MYTCKLKVRHLQHIYLSNKNEKNEKPRWMKSFGQRKCLNLGPKLYEYLPAKFKEIKIYKHLKNEVKQWLLTLQQVT